MILSMFAATPTVAAQAPKIMNIGMFAEPDSLNPIMAASISSWEFINWIFDPLVRWDDNWGIQPCLAESWEWAPNGTQLVMHIDPDATWHDGTPFTAHDAKKSLHPYTFALVSAVPIPDPKFAGRAQILSGEVPSPINPPPGCRFSPRCIFVQDVCKTDDPPLRDVGDGHLVACHFAGELDFGKSAQMEYADAVNGSTA